jgi:hypothetical protein
MLNKNFILCLFVILILLPNAFGAQNSRGTGTTKKIDQKPKPTEKPNHHVTVNLKRGDPVDGDFIQASQTSVEIEMNGVRQKIPMDEVASMVFDTESKPSAAPSRDSLLAVEAGVKSLRKLGVLTQVKPAFQDYQTRLVDVKIDVEDALAKLPEGSLKTEIKLALEAFTDAENIWDQQGEIEVIMPAKDELAAKLMQKYSIPPIEPNTDPTKLRLDRDMMLMKMWAAAKGHLDKLSSLLASYAVGQ